MACAGLGPDGPLEAAAPVAILVAIAAAKDLRTVVAMTNNNGHAMWLTVEDIAEILGQSPNTLYKWSRKGQPYFPRCSRLPNRQLRVSRTDLDKWMSERAV